MGSGGPGSGSSRAGFSPRPSAVIAAGIRLALSGELWVNMGVSFLRAITGLTIGGSLGFGLGLMNGLSRRAEEFTDTLLQMVRNVPHLALIPLVIFMVWHR